jgi:hypothetical protein
MHGFCPSRVAVVRFSPVWEMLESHSFAIRVGATLPLQKTEVYRCFGRIFLYRHPLASRLCQRPDQTARQDGKTAGRIKQP